MRTLHLYLIRQVVTTLLMTVAVFTFVLMLGNVLKEILGLLVNRQVDLLIVGKAIGLLIPYVLVLALPMGMLTAALLVFGRFSADNELTAVRASGVSLLSLVTPVLLFSAALSGVAAVINLEIAPQCRFAYKQLLVQIGLAQSGSLIPENTYLKDLDTNCIVYISKVRQSTNLEDVLIYKLREDKVESYSRADHGVITFNPSNKVFTVILSNAVQVYVDEKHRLPQPFTSASVEFAFTNAAPRRSSRRTDLGDMTYSQLQEELRELEKRTERSSPVEGLSSEELRERMKQLKSEKRLDLTLPVRIQIHRQVAFSFACIGFTLVGIPLGIRAHRRETTFGFAVALVLVVVYYGFLILGQALHSRPDLSPHLILWVPNFLFQAVGIVLLWRANRGV